jgi:hypothetical protein
VCPTTLPHPIRKKMTYFLSVCPTNLPHPIRKKRTYFLSVCPTNLPHPIRKKRKYFLSVSYKLTPSNKEEEDIFSVCMFIIHHKNLPVVY